MIGTTLRKKQLCFVNKIFVKYLKFVKLLTPPETSVNPKNN